MDHQPLTSSDHLSGGADGAAGAGVRAQEEEGEGVYTKSHVARFNTTLV